MKKTVNQLLTEWGMNEEAEKQVNESFINFFRILKDVIKLGMNEFVGQQIIALLYYLTDGKGMPLPQLIAGGTAKGIPKSVLINVYERPEKIKRVVLDSLRKSTKPDPSGVRERLIAAIESDGEAV